VRERIVGHVERRDDQFGGHGLGPGFFGGVDSTGGVLKWLAASA
jgi:hypothetical protein